ncbi:MAG: hypothetical protein V3U51_04935 [Thermoplasmata archaeon]
MDIPLEKKFNMLSQIQRASHFEWLRAAKELCPDVSELDLVLKFWEIVGHDTAKNYLKHLDPEKPLPEQIAKNFVFSSQAMGEDAEFVEGKDEKEAFAQHVGCPWFEWHQRLDKLDQDQAGCDKWLETFVDDINKELGTNLKWETVKSIPKGDEVCLRRFWVE